MPSYTRFKSLYTDPLGSDITSRTVFVGDATDITLSLTTVNGSASLFTVQVNNGDGFTATLPNAWSTVTGIAAQGEFDLEPGSRYFRLLRPSASSTTATMHMQVFA